MISLVFYLKTFVFFIPLFFILFSKFRKAYPEIMADTWFKLRLSLYFVTYESFILYRAFMYFVINFQDNSSDLVHKIKLQVYFSEIMLAFLLMYISFKNLQSDEEAGSVSERSSVRMSNNVKNSLLQAKRKADSMHVKLPQYVPEEQKQWSISNESSGEKTKQSELYSQPVPFVETDQY